MTKTEKLVLYGFGALIILAFDTFIITYALEYISAKSDMQVFVGLTVLLSLALINALIILKLFKKL